MKKRDVQDDWTECDQSKWHKSIGDQQHTCEQFCSFDKRHHVAARLKRRDQRNSVFMVGWRLGKRLEDKRAAGENKERSEKHANGVKGDSSGLHDFQSMVAQVFIASENQFQ